MKCNSIAAATLTVAVLTLSLNSAAQAVTVEASDNATVQPGGPRSGSSGKAFFNVEGSDYGSFASFGVMDFDFSGLGLGPIAGVQNVSIELTEDNASFSESGPMSFYYTAATGVDIQPGSSIAYQGTNNGTDSVDPAFGTLTPLGSGQYTVSSTGTVESFSLNFSGPAMTGFVDAINNGTVLRMIATPDSPTTAATYSGYTNFNRPGPTLAFDTVAVPEPAAFALAGVCLIGIVLSSGRQRRLCV